MEDPFLIQRNHAAELFIVRHADAIPEADEIIPSGIYDDLPLSRLGREQALALAERLGSLNFDALYSSPLRRCLQTAAPLAERLGLQPTVVEDLKEIKSLLIAYLSDKVTREADKSFNEKGYSPAVFDQWKNDHFRKSSQK